MSNANQFLGDSYALGLEIYSGLVGTAFRNNTVLFNMNPTADAQSTPYPVMWQKTISRAVSEQFLMFNQYSDDPDEHTAGDELEGQQWEVVQDTIALDEKPLKAHKSISERDLICAHFDVIQPLADQNGYALANFWDKRLIRLGINAARSASLTSNGMTIHGGGNRVRRVAASFDAAYPVSSTGASNFRDNAEALAEALDLQDVPHGQRLLLIEARLKRVLLQDTKIFDQMYSTQQQNSYNSRAIGEIAGFRVVQVNGRLPSANVLTGPTKYQGSYTVGTTYGQPAALALCGSAESKYAIGAVVAEGIKNVVDPSARKGDLMLISKLFMGADIMHPFMAGVIDVNDS